MVPENKQRNKKVKKMSSNKHWAEVLAKLVETGVFPNVAHRILLWSPEPGTGKSSFAQHKFGADKVERATLHGRMIPDDLLFQVDLEAKNGGTETIRRAGPALRALMEGKVLVLDEIDQHDPAMRCLLHALLDDREIAGVTLPDGQRVTPKEGYGVIATTNKTPQAFPTALLDRFDIVLNASQPNPDALAKLPTEVKKALINQYSRLQVHTWSAPLSVRRGIAFSKLLEKIDRETAAQIVFGNGWQDMLNVFAVADQPQGQGTKSRA